MNSAGCVGNLQCRPVRIPHIVLPGYSNTSNVDSLTVYGSALHRQATRVGGRTKLHLNRGNSTIRLALPEQSPSSSSFGNNFVAKYDSTLEDMLGSQFRMMRAMERDMEKAMEKAVTAQEGMMADASSEKKQWKREWKSQTPTSSSYFSESVTIIQPAAGAGNSRSLLAQNSSAAVALAALVPVVLLSISWARKTREFYNAYDQTVYRDTRSKWFLVSLWPILCLVSPKFRKEWDRVMVKRGRPHEAIGSATSNPSGDSMASGGEEDAVGSATATGSKIL